MFNSSKGRFSLPLAWVTVSAVFLLVSTTAACELYFDEELEYVEPVETVPVPFEDAGQAPWPDGGGEGWQCESNAECAAGCFCTPDGWCEEAGFCESDEDCANDFVCDDRASCVPENEPECSDLDADETLCIADETCSPVYRGVNCTSETGTECTAGAQDCSCESFVLDHCEETAPLPDAGPE